MLGTRALARALAFPRDDRDRPAPQALLIVLAITGTVFVAEVIGGLLSGSLALLADARHILTDSTGLLLAVLGASLATRAATAPHLRPAAGRGPGRARQPVARVCVHAPRRTSTAAPAY
jgi:hypothetical protein